MIADETDPSPSMQLFNIISIRHICSTKLLYCDFDDAK